MTQLSRFCHATAVTLDTAPFRRGHDTTWYAGVGRSRMRPVSTMPGLETVIIADALVIPTPFAILDADGALQHGTMPSHIIQTADAGFDMPMAPLHAGPEVALGRFLGEVLSIASMQRSSGPTLAFIGAPLTAPQMDAAAALNLLDRYTPITEPARVAALHVTRSTGAGLSRMIRPAIETLRFTVEPYEASARIAILAPATATRFSRTNQSSLLAWLRARSFAPLDVGTMRLGAHALGLTDLIAALAACRAVLIDDPSQAPLLGFCDPGTLILELCIDGWHDSAIATCARLFALDWRPVVAPPPQYPVKSRLPLGARQMLRTEIDIGVLDRALASVESDTETTDA